MDWYEKLAEQFPVEELKNLAQMEDLLENHSAYKKLDTFDYTVTYAEFPTFIFIDYLLVNPQTRGKGTGSQVLDRFKSKRKTIIVEVEPEDAEDRDTVRRIRFYERNGFKKAERITYTRGNEDGTPLTMDIYYWPEVGVPEQRVIQHMATICREIHNFKAMKHYGRIVADPEKALLWEP